MNSAIIKPPQLATLVLEDELKAAGYNDNEIKLINYCWSDSFLVNQNKMALAQHLWELKQAMDANDPHANGGNGGGHKQTRFWAAFEAGHLPLQGDKGKVSIHTCIRAAQWLAQREVFNPLNTSFVNLAPATICEISTMAEPALEVVLESIQSCEFIGTNAVRLLAHEKEQEVFDRLKEWIAANPEHPITPKTIQKVREQVQKENVPAASKLVDVAPILQGIRSEAHSRERQARVDSVKDELSRKEREEHERLQAKVREYNNKLNAATGSIHDLLGFLRSIDRIDGTQYLDDMRATDVLGMITVRDDLTRLKQIGEELMASVNLARSSNPPTGIDMTTVDI